MKQFISELLGAIGGIMFMALTITSIILKYFF